MRASLKRLVLWAVLLVLILAAWGAPTPQVVQPPVQLSGHVRMASAQTVRDVVARWQATPPPTPTPGTFGPIITAPPQAASPTPAGPALTLTATPAVSETPAPDLTATLSGTPLPTLDADRMGIQINIDVSDQDFDIAMYYAQQLGIKWVKFQFAWAIMEPEQGVPSETLYRYRLFVQRAQQQGFKVMVSIAKAPDWARATLEEDGPPRDPQMLASFLSLLLGEIRTDLYKHSYIDAIEIWNEPNLRREWDGGALTGGEYMRLFAAAYNAIRAAEGGPGIVVITAGLAPTGINDGVSATSDRVYLRQMYDAGLGSAAYQNIAIGVHPYGAWNPPDARCCGNSAQGYDSDPTFFFLNTIEDYRAIMQQYGDAGRQLWATEFGWGTYDGLIAADGAPAPPPPDVPYFTYIDQFQQGHYILRAFQLGQTMPYLGPMVLWNLDFAGTPYVALQDTRSAYAILGNAFDPRRFAYLLLQNAPKTIAATP